MTKVRLRYGTWLGLLAFALIILAPLFSQLKADRHDWSWLAELACQESYSPVQVGDSPFDSQANPHLEACAYCSLLLNNPVLGSPDGLPAVLAAARSTSTATTWQHIPRSLSFPDARPRAPPAHG